MKYISWNCRGLGSRLKEDALRDLIRIHKPEILLLQETKMEESAALQSKNKFWKKGTGIGNNSRGASGGIATFWDPTLYDIEAEHRTIHWIYTKLIHKHWKNGKSFQSLCPCYAHGKKRLLELSCLLSPVAK